MSAAAEIVELMATALEPVHITDICAALSGRYEQTATHTAINALVRQRRIADLRRGYFWRREQPTAAVPYHWSDESLSPNVRVRLLLTERGPLPKKRIRSMLGIALRAIEDMIAAGDAHYTGESVSVVALGAHPERRDAATPRARWNSQRVQPTNHPSGKERGAGAPAPSDEPETTIATSAPAGDAPDDSATRRARSPAAAIGPPPARMRPRG